MSVAAQRKYTPDDLLKMPDGDRFELVDGYLVERTGGLESRWIAGTIYRLIANSWGDRELGWLFPPGTGFQCFGDGSRDLRRPDVSFVRFGRFPGEELPTGHCTIAPDLVVEVVSPNDLAGEVDQRKEQFLSAGVQSVWIVHPKTRTVTIYRADGSATNLREEDELADETVLPGFCCKIRDFFPPPVAR